MIERSGSLSKTVVPRVGRQGELTPPPGAVRVDLAGKTVMPAMIDVHTHLGYRSGATFSVENYSRGNLNDQLNRFASYGVAAVASAGTDRGALTLRLRLAPPPHGAIVLTPAVSCAAARARRLDERRAVRRLDRGRGTEGRSELAEQKVDSQDLGRLPKRP